MLIFDAFTPRRVETTCNSPYDVHPGLRARDLKGAIGYLSGRNDIDHGRIGVIGLTHGAWSILYALTDANKDPDYSLSAAVALHPLCGPFSLFSAPVWVLQGEWRHVSGSYSCDKYLHVVPGGNEIVLHTYPGSQHPMGIFVARDSSINNLAREKTEQDRELIEEIHQFLIKYLDK